MTKIIICPSSLQSRDPILYGAADNKSDVSIFTCDKVSDLPSLDGITDITHIAFMYHMRASKSIPIEDDVNVTQYDDSGNPVGTEYDEFGEVTHMPSEEIGTEYRIFNKGIIEWITKMKESNSSLEIIDLLTCNIPSAIGNSERTIVNNETGLTLRYSLDQTGNSPNGNWVLESDNVDVKSLYFTDDIDNWDDVLDNQLKLYAGDYAHKIADGYGSNIVLNTNNDIYHTIQNTTQVDASNLNTITSNDDILLFDDEFDFSGDFSVEFNFDINFNSSNKFVNFGIGLLDSTSNDTQIGFQLIDHWSSISSTIQYDLYVDGDISTNTIPAGTIPAGTNIVNGKFTITRTGSSISFVLTNNNNGTNTLINETFTSVSVQSLSRLSIKNKAVYYELADDTWQLITTIHSLEANDSYVIRPSINNLIDVDTTSEPGKTIYRLKNDINISTLVTDGFITDAANFYMHIAEDEIFDGSGHTIDCDISNVTRTSSLFTVENVDVPGVQPIELTDAIFEDFPTIRNLNVTNAKLKGSHNGVLIAETNDTFYIHDVTVNVLLQDNYTSGFTSRHCSTFKIKDCVSNITDYTDYHNCSGFIGESNSVYKIVGCTTYGDLYNQSGGICGMNQGYRDSKKLDNVTSIVTYITDPLYPGVKFRLVIDDCKHDGNVQSFSGGIVGQSFGKRYSYRRTRTDVFDRNNFLIKNCIQDNGTIHVHSGGITSQYLGSSSASSSAYDENHSPDNVYINIYINNCHVLKTNNGSYTISQGSGGIIGNNSFNPDASVAIRKIYIEIKNCTNMLPIVVGHSNINNYFGGGICCKDFGIQQYSSFLIQNCTNYGSLQNNQAGIVQFRPRQYLVSHTERIIDNCVNYGDINGRSGGIICRNANGSNVLVRNCINYGAINSDFAGGIAGGTFRGSAVSPVITDDELSQNCVILHCVNKGVINANHCGGIIGGGDSITTTERDDTYGSNNYNAIRTPFVIDHCVNNGTLSTGLTGSGQLTGDNLYNVKVTRTIVPGNNRFSASYDYTENSDNPNPNPI